VKGRKPKTEAMAVIFGAGPDTRTMARSFTVPDKYAAKIELLVDKLVADLRAQGIDIELMLAALAKTGVKLAEEEPRRSTGDG